MVEKCTQVSNSARKRIRFQKIDSSSKTKHFLYEHIVETAVTRVLRKRLVQFLALQVLSLFFFTWVEKRIWIVYGLKIAQFGRFWSILVDFGLPTTWMTSEIIVDTKLS